MREGADDGRIYTTSFVLCNVTVIPAILAHLGSSQPSETTLGRVPCWQCLV
jgi:hypothetical protein